MQRPDRHGEAWRHGQRTPPAAVSYQSILDTPINSPSVGRTAQLHSKSYEMANYDHCTIDVATMDREELQVSTPLPRKF